MGQYRFHRVVDEDLVCIATYLRRENPRAAKRFLDVAFETFAFIAKLSG